MLDSYNNEQTINTVSGTLIKTETKSKFIRFHINSPMSDCIFNINEPYIKTNNGVKKSIIVLQVMLANDGYVICEIIERELENGK